MVFDPSLDGHSAHAYNLWSGLPKSPEDFPDDTKGAQVWLQHTWKIICRQDKGVQHYVVRTLHIPAPDGLHCTRSPTHDPHSSLHVRREVVRSRLEVPVPKD